MSVLRISTLLAFHHKLAIWSWHKPAFRSAESMVRNSWRHHEYSYFPNEDTVAATIAGSGSKDIAEEPGGEQGQDINTLGYKPNSSNTSSSL